MSSKKAIATIVFKVSELENKLKLGFKAVSILITNINDIKSSVEKLQKENKQLTSELAKRDRALLDFLKVKIEEVKTVKTDENGKDVIVYSYKLTKK